MNHPRGAAIRWSQTPKREDLCTLLTADTDILVVGGGAVGLAIARAALMRGREVLLIERHDRLGTETSSRNSEVIHAGLYYQPGSIRARFCVAGKSLLYAFATETGIPVSRCGKLLVATSDADLAKLESIKANAALNGVTDLVPLTASEAMALEPELSCIAACLSPSTGVIDSSAYMLALEGHITSLGGMIVRNTAATRIDALAGGGFKIETDSAGETSALTTNTVVIAGGLGASALARTITFPSPYCVPETYFAKGHYYSMSGRAPFRHLVYPMPSGSWLGVHYTHDVAGRAKFGPDFEWRDKPCYAFEDADGERRARFASAIRRYWPALKDDALSPDYTGIRPKVTRDNSAAVDFVIHGPADHGVPGLVALYGIDSPGLTASLAIGDHCAETRRAIGRGLTIVESGAVGDGLRAAIRTRSLSARARNTDRAGYSGEQHDPLQTLHEPSIRPPVLFHFGGVGVAAALFSDGTRSSNLIMQRAFHCRAPKWTNRRPRRWFLHPHRCGRLAVPERPDARHDEVIATCATPEIRDVPFSRQAIGTFRPPCGTRADFASFPDNDARCARVDQGGNLHELGSHRRKLEDLQGQDQGTVGRTHRR